MDQEDRKARKRQQVRECQARRRASAKALGLCSCGGTVVPGRKSCRRCLMEAMVKQAFMHPAFRRGGSSRRGLSKHYENGCFVDSYSTEHVRAVCDRFDGRCFYSGLPIDIGSTAGLDHNIPVSRVSAWGEAVVYAPENLVWCHQGMNYLKRDMTGDEFRQWLRVNLPAILAGL